MNVAKSWIVPFAALCWSTSACSDGGTNPAEVGGSSNAGSVATAGDTATGGGGVAGGSGETGGSASPAGAGGVGQGGSVAGQAGGGTGSQQQPDDFVHPGIFSSQAELDDLAGRVAAKDANDPAYQGYQSVLRTHYANVGYTAHPAPVEDRTINGTGNPGGEREDAVTAYTLALRWAVTGDDQARSKALEIMDAWAATYQTNAPGTDPNTRLDASWVITEWCAAGELMKWEQYQGKGASWPQEKVDAFAQFIRRTYAWSGKSQTGSGNWETSAMLGEMAVGIFLDDRSIYEVGSTGFINWLPQIITTRGATIEVFRDAWHGTVALTGTLQGAEVARHQGDLSIYQASYEGQADPRIVVALKWYANPLQKIPSEPLPAKTACCGLSKPEGWRFVGADNTAHTTGGFEMALNYYTFLQPTAGLDNYRKMVLAMDRPSGQDNGLFIQSDTMSHGDLSRAVLTPNSAPVLTRQPADLKTPEGVMTTFIANVTAQPLPAFQWYRDGAPIAGANAPYYSITPKRADEGARFYVVAKNTEGTVTSGTATLAVDAASVVAPPTFGLAGGSYTGTQSISLTSATNATAIYYSLDGSAPTRFATWNYSAPIKLTKTTTIKAFAATVGMSDSPVASATYTIK